MKKLILSLLLLIPSISFADTATTGNPQLILVSTGSVDRTRSWGDKINENFSIISSTMQTLFSSITALGTSGGPQSSFAGSIATGAVEMSGFSINNSSGFTLGTGGKITFPDGTTQITAGGGDQSSLAGSIATGPLNMNSYSVHNATNLATLDGYQIFYGSNTFMNNLTVATGTLTFTPSYPVVGIGNTFYGNPSGVRTLLEGRTSHNGFVEFALRNPSTTNGTGAAYRLSNDDINAISSRYGLTASLNTAFPSVSFIQHPSNGLFIGNIVPTAGAHPLFVKSYSGQSNLSTVGIGTAAPHALLHIVSSANATMPLFVISTTPNTDNNGKIFEVNRSSIYLGVPMYSTSSFQAGINNSSNSLFPSGIDMQGGSILQGVYYGDGSNLTGITPGGGGGSSPSTFTITLQSGQGGGLYLSTTVFNAIDSYVVIKDTVEITSIQAFTLGDVSTMTALVSINRSTEPLTSINVIGIHTSSITIRENTRVNTLFKPDTISVFYPNDRLYMYCPIPVSSGTVPSGVAVKMRGFRWP